MPFSTLVDTKTLAGKLDHPRWVVFDCRFSLKSPEEGRNKYESGHIPGARYADLDRDLSSPKQPDTGRHPLPDIDTFIGWLGKNGVNQGSQVVVYDDVGGVIAGRLWWMLRMLGHRNVAVLDGGWKAWKRGGFAVATEEPKPATGDFRGEPANDSWVTTEQVKHARRDGVTGAPIVDARSAPRFRGKSSDVTSMSARPYRTASRSTISPISTRCTPTSTCPSVMWRDWLRTRPCDSPPTPPASRSPRSSSASRRLWTPRRAPSR